MSDQEPQAPPPGIPLRDAEVATRLARSGRPLPLAELLAAFDEPEATPAARARAAAALDLAGVRALPALRDAPEDSVVVLSPLHGAPTGAGTRMGRAMIGLGAIAAVILVAALVSGGDDGGGGRVADDLPGTTTAASTARTGTAPRTTSTATTTGSTTTATSTTATSTTPTTSVAVDPDEPLPARAVVVRFAPTEPTRVCVFTRFGRELMSARITRPHTFERRRLIVRVDGPGHGMTVDGRAIRPSTQPAAYDITADRVERLPRRSIPDC